jgi:hypothetical protein
MTMLKAASLVIPVAYGWRKNSCVLRDRASLFVKNEKSSVLTHRIELCQTSKMLKDLSKKNKIINSKVKEPQTRKRIFLFHGGGNFEKSY